MPASVVRTVPACGDTAVDPELDEIRVTFSKEMMTDDMWSFCQVSKDHFPESPGGIHYLDDKRTCVLPVKLEANQTYVLWINKGKLNRFRDSGNRPAISYQLVFQTAGAGGVAAAAAHVAPGDLERIKAENKQAARERGRRDREVYSAEQLREIESLYQVANKNWRTREAVESLEEMIGKYDKANRTGCAVLYLGQMSEGEQRLKYLERAVKDFSDCYYYNGCQVGGYARLHLAGTLMGLGRRDEAEQLLEEIRTDYPRAIDHRGRLLVETLKDR
ncbi:MAG: Ig-like domain-containing protein [Verrucomicrobiales bacterium]